MKIDLKNKKILRELDLDARQSNAAIAKKVGLSKDAVKYRIERLEKMGVIKGYRTVVDMSRLGFTMYRVLFTLVNVNQATLQRLVKTLKKEPHIWGGGILDGEWDFSFLYFARNNPEFYTFLDVFKKRFRRYIKSELISPIVNYHELPRNYLLDRGFTRAEKVVFVDQLVPIDALDYRILASLSENARVRLVDIAADLKVSSMLVHQRIRRLAQNKVILGYKAYIDMLLLGRDYYGVKMNLDNYSEIDRIIEAIYALREVSAVLYTIGGYDVEFDLEVLNTKDYYRIINTLRDKFSTIREVKHMGTVDYYLLHSLPSMNVKE